MITVRDILSGKGSFVATVSRDDSVLFAAKEMNARRIGSVVVVDGARVLGIFTERDILTKIVAAQLDPEKTPVGDMMSTPVACCNPDTSLDECRGRMTRDRIRHLPVVVENNLVGIITSGDLMANAVKEQKETIEYLNQYIQGTY